MSPDLHRQMISIFSDVFQVELHSDIEDICSEQIKTWDSFNKLRLVLELEQTFGINFSDQEVEGLTSLRQAEDLVVKRKASFSLGGNRTSPGQSVEDTWGFRT